MKKVALVMNSWKRFFTYAWPSGIMKRIREQGEEINLYIFNCFASWSLDEKYSHGEYNIFELPDFSEFDGILVYINNIDAPEVTERLMTKLRASGKPIISLAHEIDGCYYAGINNYAAITDIIEHLHHKHDCERFWCVMGPEDNFENSVRVQAIKDYMDTNQIRYDADDFYYENYECQCGLNGFSALLKKKGEIPDAIICANDNIAVGVCEAAVAAGYRIPEDIRVTGFDNFDKASFYSPKITTVGHIREEVGVLAVEMLLKIWNGEPLERFNYTKTYPVYWDSCGCKSNKPVDRRAHDSWQIMYEINTNAFEGKLLALEHDVQLLNSIGEMAGCIEEWLPNAQCDAIYLALDSRIYAYRDITDLRQHNLLTNDELSKEGYPEEMRLAFVYEDGKINDNAKTTIKGLFPTFESDKPGMVYLFQPVHISEYEVGYLVLRNAEYLMSTQYLFTVVNTFSNAIENLHKKEKLAYFNMLLSKLYMTDAMTGLYNRQGYEKVARKFFEERRAAGKKVLILFLDMDRLKYINDRFGHEYGDMAIKKTASVIQNCCGENAIAIRHGGDEFVVVMEDMEKYKIDSIQHHIHSQLKTQARQEKYPFSLAVSIGYTITDDDVDRDFDDYVREADEIMYDNKDAKRQALY
ncbi:MAG: diguanylate cyclase [Lachnospiraceae bacterium]|nr:diguanylate cyclase [Lachnospiraceae bacterium]